MAPSAPPNGAIAVEFAIPTSIVQVARMIPATGRAATSLLIRHRIAHATAVHPIRIARALTAEAAVVAATDRTLMELAGRVADYNLKYSHKKNGFFFNYGKASERQWNPLDDDGDAFRLAVKCLPFHVLSYTREDLDASGGDGRAATRRAIVRLVAAMAQCNFNETTEEMK